MHQTQLQFLGWEGPLEKGMAIFFCLENSRCVSRLQILCYPSPKPSTIWQGAWRGGKDGGKQRKFNHMWYPLLFFSLNLKNFCSLGYKPIYVSIILQKIKLKRSNNKNKIGKNFTQILIWISFFLFFSQTYEKLCSYWLFILPYLVGWHHQLHGHEFEQTQGVGDGQGSLACCSPWGCRVGQDWATNLNWIFHSLPYPVV